MQSNDYNKGSFTVIIVIVVVLFCRTLGYYIPPHDNLKVSKQAGQKSVKYK